MTNADTHVPCKETPQNEIFMFDVNGKALKKIPDLFPHRCNYSMKGINEGYLISYEYYLDSNKSNADAIIKAEYKASGYKTLQQAYDDEFLLYIEWLGIEGKDCYDGDGNEWELRDGSWVMVAFAPESTEKFKDI